MHNIPPIDPGKTIDWGKTSDDYANFRPGPPLSLFDRLQALGYAQPDTNLLDLGTGTGVMAREFASRGVRCSGIDISPGQIEVAQQLAVNDGLEIDFKATSVEDVQYEENQFDTITANQCWLYFDRTVTIPKVINWLKQDGVLITSHFSWLPREDEIARATEDLILKHNPAWTAADWNGEIPPMPAWAEPDFRLRTMMTYDVPIPFTHESWRGRIRACRGVGAALSPDEVEAFDTEHAKLLSDRVDNEFTILHRIDAHAFAPRR